MTYSKYLPFATTERQREYLKAADEHGGIRPAARALGVDQSTVTKSIKSVTARAAMHDASEHYNNPTQIPDPYFLKGVSAYHKADPEKGTPAFWAKSALSQEQLRRQLQEAVELYYADVPKLDVPAAPKKQKYDTDVIPWFQIGDAHLGMLAHEAETGGNFDLKIATTELMTAFQILFAEAPSCERCVINDLGDFTHYENYKGETEASGHKLDYDGRFPKMIRAYVPLMRFIVEQALTKFKYVDVIINQGNHSRTNDIWMAELLANVYEKSDRINVIDNSNIFIPYRMGKTLVMVHHSDKCKPANLVNVMATDYAEEWGETTHRYIDMGHVHHRGVLQLIGKEHPGVIVESWNNLAAPDKYAHDGGWRSRQSITRVDRSRRYGEVGRHRLPIERIHDHIRAGLSKHVAKGYRAPEPRKRVYTV